MTWIISFIFRTDNDEIRKSIKNRSKTELTMSKLRICQMVVNVKMHLAQI